jgi:hypothetical protein
MFALLLASIGATSARATDLKYLAAAREVLALRGEATLLNTYAKQQMPRVRDSFRQANPDASEAELTAYQSLVQSELDANVDATVELEAELLADSFSLEDLRALISFYKSPAGRHFTEITPKLAGQIGGLQQQWFDGAMLKAASELDARKRREQKL